MKTKKKVSKKKVAKKVTKKKTTKKKVTKKVTKKKVAKKKAAKKTTTKKVTKKKVAKKTTKKKATKTKRAGNPAFMAAKTPSEALKAIVGAHALPRPHAVKKIWEYIKKHGLQDKVNKRNINPDSVLSNIFGKKSFSMFQLNKILSKHLS